VNVININPGNDALMFIDSRIKDEKYRGIHTSQHNRYTMNQIIDILLILEKYVPNQKLMTIRTTDISKRPENDPEEYSYAQFCNDAKEKTGIGTQDAMRKNIFVDLHRMALIERYDKNKNPIDPFSRQQVKYVSISNLGLKLISAKTVLDKYFVFSKCIDILLGGCVDILLDILRDKVYNIDDISSYEFMFFISAIGIPSNFNINTDKAVELIKEYQKLTPTQRRAVIAKLKVELNPSKFQGSKPEKRDFHNWYNETQQIFYLLNQTVYFEVRGTQLVLRTGKGSFSEISTKLDRSLNEKYLYFVEHKVEKTAGFELHHIVPLSWSENIQHFKLLDKWENMVYIDGFSHAKITQNNNRNIILSMIKNDIILADYSNNKVYLEYRKNILYNPKNKGSIQKYNFELLNTIK